MLQDLKTLYHLTLAPIRGETHAERLESFYSKQSDHYDAFRSRLLPGRKELIESLDFPVGGVWLDMGGGTGSNLEWAGTKLNRLSKVVIVDLSPSLAAVARKRIKSKGWSNVEVVEADVTTYQPAREADLITFSYSLTMMPDWFLAIEQAKKILKPNGRIAVADFYVSRKFEPRGRQRHTWGQRAFWSQWFAADNVFLSGDHIPFLQSSFKCESLIESHASIPYLPLFNIPTYRFIGKKR